MVFNASYNSSLIITYYFNGYYCIIYLSLFSFYTISQFLTDIRAVTFCCKLSPVNIKISVKKVQIFGLNLYLQVCYCGRPLVQVRSKTPAGERSRRVSITADSKYGRPCITDFQIIQITFVKHWWSLTLMRMGYLHLMWEMGKIYTASFCEANFPP